MRKNDEYDKVINSLNLEKLTALSQIQAQKTLNQDMKATYEKMIASMKESVVNNMKAETEKLLKQREEELTKGNKSTMDDILRPLKSSIDDMQKAMKENADSHLKNTTELSKQLEQAVKDMKDETSSVGKKADILSEALTGKPKVQGCFGENFLESILANEGLIKNMHYTREEANEDRSRPDFVFHFKDGLEEKDLIVDSKVSMTAFVQYMNAETEEEKKIALDQHVRSVRRHINELAAKEYTKKTAKAFADYVLMFMPRDMAFRVALEADPMIWQDAYEKNVLITTEQTIVPFLKIMQLTWNKYQHDSNILEITKAASNMIDRVGAFYDSYKELGKKLNAVCKEYNSGVNKLKDDGKSITTSARQVMKIGVKREKGKEMTVPTEQVQELSI